MKQKLIILFLSLVSSFGLCAQETSGIYNNLTWSLIDGVLTISGNGDMVRRSDANYPWLPYMEDDTCIHSLIVEEGVTSIARAAFNWCQNLKNVHLPYSLQIIEGFAFDGCKNLQSVNILSADSIGLWAFCNTNKPYWLVSHFDIICNTATPPHAHEGAFYLHDTQEYTDPIFATVYVPAGSLEAYNNTFPWNTLPIRPFCSVSDIGWASFYLDYNAKVPEGITVYYAKSATDSTITLSPIEAGITIPANTAIIVRADEGAHAFIESSDTPITLTNNLLEGVTEDTNVSPNSVYVLADGNSSTCIFANYEGTTLGAYKAYIPKTSVPANAASIRFIIENQETTTSIETNQHTNYATIKTIRNGEILILRNGSMYDIMGRRR